MGWLLDAMGPGQLRRIAKAGSIPWDEERSPFTPAEREIVIQLRQAGKLEVFEGIDGFMHIRLPVVGPPKPPPKAEALPYEVTPAILALRARKRQLGR